MPSRHLVPLLLPFLLLAACGGNGALPTPDLAEATLVGIEVLTTPELESVAELQPGDQLYVLPEENEPGTGDPVLVRVRAEVPPLMFATACASLARFRLPPGWDAICLERRVNGEVESGVFRYGSLD